MPSSHMFKFFRKIRYDLMEKNKTGKYLKYAIGEVVLVVIGILIALSINNWNDERLNSSARLIFYRNLKQQLLDDAGNIESQIRYNDKNVIQFEDAVQWITLNDRSAIDSLSLSAIGLMDYSDFDRQGNIYEIIVNSGNVKLVRNTEIIERLRRLEETYIYVNRMETIHYDAITSMIPEIIKTVRLSSNKIIDEENLYGGVFENLFVLALKIMDEKDEVYKRALTEIQLIVSLIDYEMQ